MRVTALILGLVAAVISFFQSCLASFGSGIVEVVGDAEQAEELSAGAGGGFIAAFVAIIAAGLALKYPRASFFLFLFAALIAIATGAGGAFSDLVVWGVVYAVCAVFSYFGQSSERRWPFSLIRKSAD